MNRPKEFKSQKHSFCNTEEEVKKTKLNVPATKSIKSKENKHHFPVKTEIKKTLVRNVEKPVPTTRVIKDDLKESTNKGIQTNSKRRQTCTKNNTVSFDVPKPYTILKLSKKLECTDKEAQTKKDKNLAADEKVLRNLNFPYDKPIYKDLIPLACEKANSPPPFVRSPLPQKDTEPVLSDFIDMKKIPKHYILPSVDIDDKILPSRNNNLRLYKILDINSYL